jgi:hypothetical protein
MRFTLHSALKTISHVVARLAKHATQHAKLRLTFTAARARGSSYIASIIFLSIAGGCGGGGSSDSGSPVTPTSSSGTHALPTQYFQQQESNWCWAAAEQMALSNYGLFHAQSEIVTDTEGQLENVGGSTQDIVTGLSYFSNGTITAQTYGPLSFPQIQSAIAQNAPIIVLYANSDPTQEGHFVVIYGYTDSGNVLIFDPIFGQFSVPYSNSFDYGTGGAPLVWEYSIVV